MTTPEMNVARFWNTASTSSDWRVYDAKGNCHAFGLTEERAKDWAKTIKGARAVQG